MCACECEPASQILGGEGIRDAWLIARTRGARLYLLHVRQAGLHADDLVHLRLVCCGAWDGAGRRRRQRRQLALVRQVLGAPDLRQHLLQLLPGDRLKPGARLLAAVLGQLAGRACGVMWTWM